ncbi:MAG: hypothetical protein Q4E59_06890 [Bacteroidales bacterium]|nr:hypothetical protein [Bacteroidales bacterium]
MRHTSLYKAILLALTLTLAHTMGDPASLSARNKTTGKAQAVNINGKPAGESFVVSWRLVLDSLDLGSNNVVVYTPVIEDELGHTATMRPLMVTGRNQHYVYLRNGNDVYADAIEVRRRNDEKQTFAYREAIALEEWMREATVRINVDTCGCGNLLGQSLGNPVPVNPHLERRVALAFLPPVATEEPTLTLQGKAYLDYPVNRTELFPEYHNNPAELHKIMQTIDTVRNNPNVEITYIGIHGYASPEGSYENNIRLAKGRAATLKDYVRNQYTFPESLYHVQYTPEDWEGLDSFLVHSALPERDAILSIVRTSMDPDAKNDRIRFEYPETYRFILNAWYPYLRHADYTVSYKIRPMSDEEAAKILRTDPRLLSLNRMYRIANLYEPGSKEYNEVLAIAVRIYPDAPVANVNAANVALRENDLAAAKKYLEKSGDSKEAIHARGVLAILEGRYAEAEPLLKMAQAAGVEEAETNLNILYEQISNN